MADFGKFPSRMPDSFGVAGLLAEECQVYYGRLFSTRRSTLVS